jgi:hypothetical protein
MPADRKRQAEAALSDTSALPVRPQARRVEARKRLALRSGTVCVRRNCIVRLAVPIHTFGEQSRADDAGVGL